MMRSIRFAVFSALMLAAPAAMAKPLIIDHRDNGNHYGQNERVPSGYGYGHGDYGWTPVVDGISARTIRVDETMVIRGSRFTPGIRVFLGGEEMQASITPTQIRFTVPRATLDGALTLRVPGIARPLMLGTIEVLGRWEHAGFRAWEPVQAEVAFYRPRIARLNAELARARELGREALIDRIKAERRAEVDRHERVMDRLWAQYFARR
jgi:hypothetical protein